MKFKLKDYVRVKAGVCLAETGELVPGWVGEVTELPNSTDDTTYMIELDTLSLQQLPDKYNQECIESEYPPFHYCFEEDDLEPSVQRDTIRERAAQQNQMEDTYFSSDEDDTMDNTTLLAWYTDFEQSTFFSVLDKEVQNEVNFTLDLFSDYAFNYCGDQPEDWTTSTVKEVCLEILPEKYTARIEGFWKIGDILTQFFAFLSEHRLQENALQLHREIKKIVPDMIRNAQNPRNWGMAKSMMMGALEADIDLSDQNALNKFISSYQSQMITNLHPKPLMQPARHNPFKNLSRNQVIKVKYPDGKVVEGKFKRLESDLIAGVCELIV